jgi:glycine/sarcosine/betaine reductase complex component A
VVVLLGTPTAESSELYAVTLTQGDPAWAGALAGVALKLPVYHILEPDVKTAVPDEVYDEQVSFAALTLDGAAIEAAVRQVREQEV